MIAPLVYVICDRCAEQSDPATDAIAARVATSAAGWAIVRDAISVMDYCPRCSGRRAGQDVTSTSSRTWVCPECEQGKHGNCDGWAWDFDADEKVQCQCTEVHT